MKVKEFLDSSIHPEYHPAQGSVRNDRQDIGIQVMVLIAN